MEKQIRVTTKGRLTIPKRFRDLLKISDGQPILVMADSSKKELVLVVQPVMSDYGSTHQS